MNLILFMTLFHCFLRRNIRYWMGFLQYLGLKTKRVYMIEEHKCNGTLSLNRKNES